jgi:hypothetical protein
MNIVWLFVFLAFYLCVGFSIVFPFIDSHFKAFATITILKALYLALPLVLYFLKDWFFYEEIASFNAYVERAILSKKARKKSKESG